MTTLPNLPLSASSAGHLTISVVTCLARPHFVSQTLDVRGKFLPEHARFRFAWSLWHTRQVGLGDLPHLLLGERQLVPLVAKAVGKSIMELTVRDAAWARRVRDGRE